MKSRLLLVMALLVMLPFSVLAQQKVTITKAEDLPKHTYDMEIDDAVAFIQKEKNVLELAALMKEDLLSDLATYDIKDKSSLRSMYVKLRDIALLEQDYEAVLKYIKLDRLQTDKESDKLTRGLVTEALVTGLMKEKGNNDSRIGAETAAFLDDFFKGVDFAIIQEEVEYFKGILEIYGENIVMGRLQGAMQTKLDNNKGKIPLDLAHLLIDSYCDLHYFLPYKESIYSSYLAALDRYGTKKEMPDIWKERDIALIQDDLNEVVIGIWDSGIDMSVFGEKYCWVNNREVVDQKDNDDNGFVDDVNGVGFDKEGVKSTSLLLPVEHDASQIDEIKVLTKGFFDLVANISSPEASNLKKHLSTLEPDEFDLFIEQLGLYTLYTHGTHVAGIAVDGNPQAKIMCARLTFDHRNIPAIPTIEKSNNWAHMFTDVVDYFKANDVKVVNMSWSVDYNYEFVRPLEINGYGKDTDERKALAKKLFEIEHNAFMEAVASAPEILFICAAGNENNDADFAASFPASLNYPNLITVGAVDKAGRKTSFTTEGESVDVFANGYEVDSYVPGGDRMAFSGTSMASPQVANLAAKLFAVNPILSARQIAEIIKNTSTKTDEGIHLIHPQNAVKEAKNTRLMDLEEFEL